MQVLFFLLETFFFVLIGSALLRAWMNQMRVQMTGQPGRFVIAVTDWLVRPLRRFSPQVLARSRVDWGSLMAALLLALVYAGFSVLLHRLAGGMSSDLAPMLPLLALRMLLRVLLQGLIVVLLVYAVLSWVQPQSPVLGTLDRLCSPMLRPLRRLIPLVGGVDLSVLVLLILLQIGLILLG